MAVSTIRFEVAGICLFLFSLLRRQPLPNWPQVRSAIIIGILLSGFATTFVGYAIKFMPTGLVALLVGMLPIWVVLIDYLFFSKQKPGGYTLVGLGIGLLGMLVLINPFSVGNTTELVFWPTFLVVFAGISWAYGSLLSVKLPMPRQLQSSAIQLMAGGVIAGIFSFIAEPEAIAQLPKMTHETYLALAYLIVVGSFIGYSAFTWLTANAAPELIATYAYVNPVVAMLLGWIFIGEKLTLRTLIASSIVLMGVVLITIGRRKK